MAPVYPAPQPEFNDSQFFGQPQRKVSESSLSQKATDLARRIPSKSAQMSKKMSRLHQGAQLQPKSVYKASSGSRQYNFLNNIKNPSAHLDMALFVNLNSKFNLQQDLGQSISQSLQNDKAAAVKCSNILNSSLDNTAVSFHTSSAKEQPASHGQIPFTFLGNTTEHGSLLLGKTEETLNAQIMDQSLSFTQEPAFSVQSKRLINGPLDSREFQKGFQAKLKKNIQRSKILLNDDFNNISIDNQNSLDAEVNFSSLDDSKDLLLDNKKLKQVFTKKQKLQEFVSNRYSFLQASAKSRERASKVSKRTHTSLISRAPSRGKTATPAVDRQLKLLRKNSKLDQELLVVEKQNTAKKKKDEKVIHKKIKWMERQIKKTFAPNFGAKEQNRGPQVEKHSPRKSTYDSKLEELRKEHEEAQK